MIKLGIRNFFVIGILALLFIVLGKVIFTKYQIKGVSDLFQAA